ncbi:uncharacterized protein LOC129916437 [Episyrphus balteatus]|uniref:uncharacterized protein LOC129916437 n=1 Tax=Episyrphus balteatus TaxID=286459 RepID=UPI00248697CD|nr:uncharacterized protein LOC129916437 [Episyrphus balteatus]
MSVEKCLFINGRQKPFNVRELMKIDFPNLPLSDKLRVLELGPPRPKFCFQVEKETTNTTNSTQNGKTKSEKKTSHKKDCQMIQASKIYKEFDWACGCEFKKLFYCYPCVLLNVSNQKGSANPSIKFRNHHLKQESHIKNALDIALLGKTITINKLENGVHKTHNESVRRNRQLLVRIIKGFLDSSSLYEYVLNGECSWNAKLDPCSLMEVVYKVDNTLKECYEQSPFFNAIKPDILQEQILKAALQLYQSKVLEEVNAAKYIAIITEETTDLVQKDQIALTLRYITDNRVVERFWTLLKPPERNPKAITERLLAELNKILPTNKDKLIAQSHIGGVIFSPQIADLHRLITVEYRNAIYVHYHAYKLTEVMERAVCQNSRVRDFFANLYGMYGFFERQPRILQAFYDATPVYCEGSFEKGALVFIYENKRELLNFMILLHTDLDSSPQFIREADVCEKLLTDDSFMYFLSFFYYLMADVNVFYVSLQNSFVDSVKISQGINEFLDEIRKTKDAIAVENSDNDDKTSEAFMRAFAKIEVCNVILKEIQERFSFTNHWEAHILFKSEQYYKFHGNFPDSILQNAIEYFKFQYPDKLRIELQILYTRTDMMICRNAHDLLYMFQKYKLTSIFEKTTALLHVILTIPTMLMDAESKICAMRRVRRAAALASNQSSETGLTMLLAERETLLSFSDFAESLVDVFVKQERHQNEFTYY